MPRLTRFEIARTDILAALDKAGPQTYTRKGLAAILEENRDFWRLAKRTTVDQFIDFLRQRGQLHHHKIQSTEAYKQTVNRYTWGEVSDYKLATAIRPNSYLCHGSAVFLHGLTDLIPKTIYINHEQSPKFYGSELTQRGITFAFSRPQRTSKLVFKLRGAQVVVVSGKNTGRLEVEPLRTPAGDHADGTSLERTLIDIVVRPSYAGGIFQVLEAYKSALDRVSANRLVATLKKLSYVYPYHQSIGFLMERAGYEPRRFDVLREMPTDFDFYLTHGMKNPAYDKTWRLYFPRELQTSD